MSLRRTDTTSATTASYFQDKLRRHGTHLCRSQRARYRKDERSGERERKRERERQKENKNHK